ncbi:MAG: hypothetical protein BAJALOKI3v1_930015 [Promethearchaeota archaeon]|nr:MAG: hypothetical protein BAJALOKI3v1_930015 [Candidatus Lokiarchaeota archaeon]
MFAKWRSSNGQKYLEIFAPDYYRLGLLLGEYLYDQIISMKRLIQLFSLRYLRHGITYNRLLRISKLYHRYIPKYLQMEMIGISDTIIRINYNDILLQNCFLDILYGYLIPKIKIKPLILNQLEFGCTSFGIFGKKEPLMGQNFDFSVLFRPTASFVHLITPRLSEIFSLRLGSLLSLPIGLNNWGLNLRVSVVKTLMSGNISMPSSILSRLAFENCQDAESYFSLLKKFGGTASYNLLISDQNKIIALEGLSDKIERIDINSRVAKTNTFVSLKFQRFLLDKSYSKFRQYYAEYRLNRLSSQKLGKVQEEDISSIMRDNSIICRKNPFKPMTLAFLTNTYFGLGSPDNERWGIIPFKGGEVEI